MAEVVKKEPVHIENVNLIINVINISKDDFGQLALQSDGNLSNGFDVNYAPIDSNGGESGALQGAVVTPQIDNIIPKPIGWIACSNGSTIPFGVQPISAEISTFGDKAAWEEIRICLPSSFLAETEIDMYCPVAACREKLGRNKSIDSHLLKHVGVVSNKKPTTPISSKNGGFLPCPISYYCHEKACQYFVETAEKSFKTYKYVKQHYQKVHAPKLFECEQCKKTFSTQKVAETHRLMCGETYSCSTCDASYNTLEVLQTHCRRKVHVYDHNKYKDRRNSVKQGIQSLKNTSQTVPATTAAPKKPKGSRKFPVLLPKVAASSSEGVISNIQALCQKAGMKVDYGCQTICTTVIQKCNSAGTVFPAVPQVSQKKRKSTDTQTNIVKCRATCSDQKHNATNTNLDWKKVMTSDSQTQTADNFDGHTIELLPNASSNVKVEGGRDFTQLFNNEFATIKISETASNPFTTEDEKSGNIENELENGQVSILGDNSEKAAVFETNSISGDVKVECGPNLYEEFISFLEEMDSATQTDPDIFANLGGDLLGINVNLDEFSGTEKHAYVSVSSTASQTGVEMPPMSGSNENCSALLSNVDEKIVKNSNESNVSFESTENLENVANGILDYNRGIGIDKTSHGDNDLLVDWEGIIQQVYRDGTSNNFKV